jgi:hypothetical protein
MIARPVGPRVTIPLTNSFLSSQSCSASSSYSLFEHSCHLARDIWVHLEVILPRECFVPFVRLGLAPTGSKVIVRVLFSMFSYE